jgi:tetratricopeptide (TPR) repeat protein
VVIEAKRNLIEFLERMNALGQLDQAFQSVKEFADQFSGSQEIRMMLVELLRAASREDEAREQLEKLAGQLESRGGRRSFDRPPTAEEQQAAAANPTPVRRSEGGLVFLDTGVDVPVAAPGSPGPGDAIEAEPPDGLMLTEPVAPEALEAGAAQDEGADLLMLEELPTEAEDLAPIAGLEAVEEIALDAEVVAEEDLGLDRVEPADLEFEGMQLEGMDETILDTAPEPVPDDDGLIDTGDEPLVSFADDAAGEPDPDESMDLDLVEAGSSGGLPLIEVEAPGTAVAELESRVLDDPENPALHQELGDALLATTDAARGREELELALEEYERREEWPLAARVADRLIVVAPDVIRYHQKRVELAYRTGDRAPLLQAYLSLGDALARAGATDKAEAVYNRVREHDPGNTHALAALAGLAEPAEAEDRGPPARVAEAPADQVPAGQVPADSAPVPARSPAPPPAAPRDGAFVDLGSMILDEGGPRDTRMRIDRREPEEGDEQREFQEILEQFKRGIEQNLEVDDYEAHYDLGVAFKEMGLLDEAIAEFQKALRSPDGRLRTSEALGICFFDKGQFAISETVLRRAVETIDGGDEAKIGLLYWLGRAAEAQGKAPDAIGSYERALAVDIRFMDLSQRIHRLTAGRRE